MSTDSDIDLREQLSALMDGELPEEQARFLRRRLEHDAELRAAWSRLQLASACLKGHRVRPQSLDCAAIRADAATPAAGRRWWRVAAAASVAALAVALAPRLLAPAGEPAPVAVTVAPMAAAVARATPSPASADLVAIRPTSAPAVVVEAPRRASPAPAAPATQLVASNEDSAPSSPLPADSQSPTDFPLVDTGQKSWPRSGLPGAANDPQLEAYLVRHNQMLANDGLGGFVPYVDVVARDPARSAADAAPAATEPATK